MRSPPLRRPVRLAVHLVLAAGLLVPTAGIAQSLSQVAPRPSFSQPALSPDGAEITFVSGGDIWTVPARGGDARLLVSHEANESRPLYSPGGGRLAFVSDRGGSDDLYVLDLGSGAVDRLTWSDADESLDAWSPDGRWLYYSSTEQNPGGMPDVFRIAVSGGSPVPVSAAPYQPEFFAAPAPDGRGVAVSARGRMGFSQWWRNGSSHIDEAEIWLVGPGEQPTYRRVTARGAKHLWPMWSSSGDELVYMSDRDGTENLWIQPLDGEPRRLTSFADGRVLWPSSGARGRSVVFERDFSIWSVSLDGGEAREVPIRLTGAGHGPGVEHLTLRDGFADLALAPDGEKVAFIARGDLFAAPSGEGTPAQRVTSTGGPESEPVWAPDSRRVAYVSRRDAGTAIYLYDFATREERRVTTGSADATPSWSPDGTQLAFARDGERLMVVDVDSGRERELARAQLWRAPFTAARPLAWSPDGRWVAFFATDDRMFTNVHVAPADASVEARAISRMANSSANSLAWSPDGAAIFFDTQHRTEPGQIARVDLVPRTPVFREEKFQELFETPAAAEETGRAEQRDTTTEPVEIEFDGIFERLTLLPLGVDAGALTVAPDGMSMVFTASAQGQSNLFSFSLDPLSDDPPVAKQLTSSAGGKGLPWFTPDGDRIFYLERGRIASVGADGDEAATLAVTAERDVDFDREKLEVFDEGWSYLRDHFFDADMNGADWDAVRERFAPRIAGARTRPELQRLMNLMVGELDASHLGHTEPSDRRAETGRLGVRFDPQTYERDGVFRIAEVVPLGPASVAGVRPGEVLVAVNGARLARETNVDRLLEHTVGTALRLRVSADSRGRDAREVIVKPISTGAERELEYRAWVADNRDYVRRASGGRLGYVHMRDMSWNSLQRLLVDLDAENFSREGVVVDLRANTGGFVNAYALDVFARRGYITFEVRGYPAVPARSMLGQRALEAPTVLVTDLNSLSDAEDFSEGYQALDLGTVVGEPTGGWIVYTWGLELVDGSSFRMPRSRVRALDGEVMEMNPRPVDVPVLRPLGEDYSGRDSQLDAAVAALLERLGSS